MTVAHENEGSAGTGGAPVPAAVVAVLAWALAVVSVVVFFGARPTLDADQLFFLVDVVGAAVYGTVTVGKNRCGPESVDLSADGGILLNKLTAKLGSRTDDKSVDFFYQCAKPGTTTGTVTVTANPGNVPGPQEKVTRTITFECQQLQMEFAPPMVEVTAIEKKVSAKRKILLKKKAGPAVDVTVTSASCVVPDPGRRVSIRRLGVIGCSGPIGLDETPDAWRNTPESRMPSLVSAITSRNVFLTPGLTAARQVSTTVNPSNSVSKVSSPFGM